LSCFKASGFAQEARISLSLEELLLGPRLIEILQSLYAPQLNWVFLAVSFLGSDTALAGLSAVVYWCIDKRRGKFVTYVLFLGAYLNFFMKILVPWPRPPVNLRLTDKNVTSYGFPSGHTQDSTTFWTWISLDFRKRVLAILGTAIVTAVGISRIYLGVHYPAQVIGGLVVGLAVPLTGLMIVRHVLPRTRKMRVMPQVLFAVAALFPLVLAVVLGAVGDTNPGRIGGYLFGFWVGSSTEARYVRFTNEISRTRRVIRVVIGGAITGLIVLVLGEFAPGTDLVTSFTHSMVSGLVVALIAPALFSMIERNLAKKLFYG